MVSEVRYSSALIEDYELFRCPVTGAPLERRGEALVSREDGHRYSLHDGIPDFAAATIGDSLKEDIQSFWNHCPNGSVATRYEPGSGEFYAETERHNHQLHRDFETPFLRHAIGFEEITHQRVLEVGCGIGMDSIQFARRANEVYCVDLSLPSVKLTLGRFHNEGYQAHAAVADAENLPFGLESFDVVYSYGVLHHTPDTPQCIRQLFRVLKPGGRAIVMLYAKYSAMTLCRVGLHHGIREGQILRLRSWKNLLSHWTELQSKTENSVNPLTQVFSAAECRAMFRDFSHVEMEKHYLTEWHLAEAHHLLKITPRWARRHLPGLLGWNLIIKAVK
jgi:ubiquinone/menaquinone biosynthesis C-methylase UbiE